MNVSGNPRNKVALKPGHSLMDWIRLCNSGVDMSGCGGASTDVSPQLLASHNNVNSKPWTAINGIILHYYTKEKVNLWK
jgi:cytochrome-b5 reductase